MRTIKEMSAVYKAEMEKELGKGNDPLMMLVQDTIAIAFCDGAKNVVNAIRELIEEEGSDEISADMIERKLNELMED